jgi:hypothetical protein
MFAHAASHSKTRSILATSPGSNSRNELQHSQRSCYPYHLHGTRCNMVFTPAPSAAPHNQSRPCRTFTRSKVPILCGLGKSRNSSRRRRRARSRTREAIFPDRVSRDCFQEASALRRDDKASTRAESRGDTATASNMYAFDEQLRGDEGFASRVQSL